MQRLEDPGLETHWSVIKAATTSSSSSAKFKIQFQSLQTAFCCFFARCRPSPFMHYSRDVCLVTFYLKLDILVIFWWFSAVVLAPELLNVFPGKRVSLKLSATSIWVFFISIILVFRNHFFLCSVLLFSDLKIYRILFHIASDLFSDVFLVNYMMPLCFEFCLIPSVALFLRETGSSWKYVLPTLVLPIFAFVSSLCRLKISPLVPLYHSVQTDLQNRLNYGFVFCFTGDLKDEIY